MRCLLATLCLPLMLSAAYAGSAAVRADSARVTVTYVAGDAVYLSVGRDAGVADSSLCYVVERNDTMSVLKVVATSSKSSVCRVVRTRRPLAIGDVVKVFVAADAKGPSLLAPVRQDSAATGSEATPLRSSSRAEPPAFSLHGRMNAQYSATRRSGAGNPLVRPGIVLSLRGAARDVPVTFDFYGNFRSLSYGGAIFGKGSTNQSRIYTLSLQFDDGSYRVAAGRVSQALIGSAGYIDGVVLSRRFGDLRFGISGGFEPLFSQRSFGSDFRKFSLFGNYSVEGATPASATIAYSRSFYHNDLDRDVATGSVTLTPSTDWFLMVQGDVDLHAKRGDVLVAHPVLSNLYSSMRYRMSQILAVGVGLTAWRPTYAFSSVSTIPDSMLDHALRTSPTANLSLTLPAGVSINNTYSTRSSDAGFGKEYSNFTSVNFSNLLNQGISARGSVSLNSTTYVRMQGLGGALQKSFGVADATVRYQWYKYAYTSWGGESTSRTAGMDLMIAAFSGVTFWGSVERMMSTDASTTSLVLDIGWRF